MKRYGGKTRFFAVFFGIISLTLAVTLGLSVFVILRLNKRNMYSKSIMLGNNYFLNLPENSESSEDSDEESNTYSKYAYLYEDKCEIPNEAPEFTDEDLQLLYNDEHNNEIDIIMKEIGAVSPEITLDPNLTLEIARTVSRIYDSDLSNEERREAVGEYLLKYWGISIPTVWNSDKKAFINVPYISQEGILPNGCESVSAVMLLRHSGFDITPEDFVDNYLDCKPVTIKFGCRYGPNPKYYYAGDPRSEKWGCGCFSPVIVRALGKYLPKGYKAVNTTGMSLEALKKKYIDNDIPVAVWVTVGMEEVSSILQWQSENKSETFLYPENKHCMVFIGYDKDNYIFADPYNSNGIVSYPIKDCETAHSMLGLQSVAVVKSK